MKRVTQVRASRDALAGGGSGRQPIFEPLREQQARAATSPDPKSFPEEKPATARRWPWLAVIGGVLALGAAALWQFDVPKSAPPASTAAGTPAFPDIPVADIPKTVVASLEPSVPSPAADVDGEQQAQRADNVTHAGEVLAAGGDLPEALRLYRQALAIRRVLAAHHPDNLAWQHAAAGGWTRVADVLKLQGETTRALGSYRAAEAIEQRCASAQPENPEFQRELFLDALSIGNLLLAQNDPAGALEAFRRGLAVQQALCDREPTNAPWRCDLATGFQRVADALDLLGDDEGALQGYRNALLIDAALVIHDPSNRDWQDDLAMTRRRVGDLLLARNETEAASEQYGGALAVLQKLVDLDATNAEWQRELAETHDRVGQALEVRKHPDEALPPYRQALTIARNLAEGNLEDGSLQGLVAGISYHLGRATTRCQPADRFEARRALEDARDLLVKLRSADGAAFSRTQADTLDETERLLARLEP